MAQALRHKPTRFGIELDEAGWTAVPPAILYHGTALETAVIILRDGLKPMKRQYVHLSPDIEIARIVGRRKASTPVILRVRALAAHEAGVNFYGGNELTWLAEPVPPEFLEMMA